MGKKEEKTNVMRLLDQAKIEYKHYCYAGTDAVGGMEVVEVLHQDPDQAFKTLVTVGKSGEHYVFAIPVNQELDLKKAELKKTADKAAAEADMVKQTVTAEKQRELYVAQQEAQIAAETKKVELAERQVAVKERELDATVRKQAEADRYAAEQKADAELYTRTKNAEAAKVEAQNKSDADLYSAQKTAEGVSTKAKAEAEATRLKGEADGAAEKAHGEGVAAGIKAQTEAYNGMENAYLLANRYIDVMPEVAEAVAKPLTAVDSIKMYGDGNATKLVRDTTGMVDQVTSGLKDATGIDLTELLSSFHQPFQPREDNE